MSFDLLLIWASEKGNGSWTQFRSAHDWLLNSGKPERQQRPAWQAAQSLATLGHMEVDWARGRWAIAPPVLTMLPSAGAHALLAGSRTRTLLERLRQETSDSITMDVFVVEVSQWSAPTAVLLASEDERPIEALAARLGIGYTYSISEQLSRLLPDLAAALAASHTDLPAARGYGIEKFDSGVLLWVDVFEDKDPGLYRYRVLGRPHFRFKDMAGQHHDLDLATGIYAELARRDQDVLRYETNNVNGVLTVPARAPLPVLQARAAALCSGLEPEFFRGEQVVRYVNVPIETAERVALSLGQRLRMTKEPS